MVNSETKPETKNEWKFDQWSSEWTRKLGDVTLVVWKQGLGYPWDVTWGTPPSTSLAKGRHFSVCATLEQSKFNAEKAARTFATKILKDLEKPNEDSV